jgi:hypothetical protein
VSCVVSCVVCVVCCVVLCVDSIVHVIASSGCTRRTCRTSRKCCWGNIQAEYSFSILINCFFNLLFSHCDFSPHVLAAWTC